MKVELGTLKDKGDELAEFLGPRVGAKPRRSGDSIEIDEETLRAGVRPRQVKTYIKRFLYMNGVRKKYRVFVSGKELTIQEIELGEEEEEEKAEEPAAAPPEKEKPEGPEEKAPEPAEEAPPAEKGPKAKGKKGTTKKPRGKKKAGE